MSVFSKVITSIFGKKSDKDLKALSPLVLQINTFYKQLEKLSDNELQDSFNNIKM